MKTAPLLAVQLQMHELEVAPTQLNLFDAPLAPTAATSPPLAESAQEPRLYVPPRPPRAFCGGAKESGEGCRKFLPHLPWQSEHFRCASCFGTVPLRPGHTLIDFEGKPSGGVYEPNRIARLIPRLPRPRTRASAAPARETEEREAFDVAAIDFAPAPVDAREAAKHDRLLQWMALVGSASVGQLADVAAMLHLEDAALAPMQWLRRARMLGHAEVTRDGARFAAPPPVLLQMSAPELFGESAQWIWCGGRDAELLERVKQHADVEFTAQAGAPSRVLVRCQNMPTLLAGLRAQVEPHRMPMAVEWAGETLALRLPTLAAWAQDLSALSGVRPHDYDLRRWCGATAHPVPLVQGAGFYEFWSRADNREPAWQTRDVRPKFHALHDGDGGWRSCSWYDGRFAGRVLNGECPNIGYDAASQRLILPLDWRPPEPFERALTFCSGLLAQLQTQKGVRWLVWGNVPLALAQKIKALLGAPLSSF